eukprot:INCI17121.2.p1 GENE.INCI17121.2~~INCI17121.2.p1  ORF type:complete len:1225 (+),score=182.08 INCI17121.2:980-4654(+)
MRINVGFCLSCGSYAQIYASSGTHCKKKEQLEGHYNEATPETRTFALRGKLPRETFVLKLHSLSGLSSVGNLKNSRIYTTVSFGNGPSHVLPEREGVEGYDPRLGSDLVVLDQTVCETIFHSHSMSEGDIFITLHVRPSSSTIFRTATVHVPYYDVRRKDFLINIPIPVFSGDMDTGGECVLRISAFSVQGPLAGHSEGPTPRRDTLNDDVPSRVDQSRTVFSQTLLQQHRHLFDALAAYDPVDSLDWTLDAIRGDVFRKHAFQIPYIATPMGAPFISSFLSIFGHAWFKRYRDRGQRGFASGVGGLAATIFHSANFENVSERLVLGKVPASYEQSKIDVAFVRVLHGFYLERTNRIKGMFVQSQSHLCVEVSVIDMSSNRRPSVAVAGHGRLDTAEAGLDEPLIGPVAAKIGSLTHAFNQTYCLHLGATGNGAGYDSLAVRIRVLNRDSLDHLQVVGGTIMPLVGDERSVVAGAKTPLEQVLIWNEQALLMQEDNLRKNRAQFTLVDATKFVGVLQVHLEVQERSGKRNVPNETLIPYSSFSQYCSALSDQLDAENLLQHELVHSPAEHNAAQNLYTSSSTILAALKETRPIKVTYEKLQGDKILIPTTIPTKFAARHSLVLSDYKLYVRCGNDHFEINLAAYKLEVSDFSKLATAQSTTFSITVIDRNDLQIGSVVVADGNEGKHGGNSKSAASGDEAKTKSKHPHDLSFVRRTGGFMRFIISATDGRALDFTQQASHTTDIKIWHDIVAEAAAFFDFSAANDLGYTAIADATNPTQKMMFKQRHLRMRSLLAHGIRQYLALCRLMSKHSDLDLLPDSRGVMDVLVFYSAANRDDKLIGMGAQALQDHIEPLLHEGLKYGIIPFTLCPLSTSFRSLLRHPSHDEVVADEDPIGSPGLDGETMTESDRFPSAEQILRLHESRTWCNTVAQDKVAKGGPFLSVGHSSRGLQRPRVSSQPALGMEPDGPKPYGLSMPCFWHFRRKSVHLTAILKGAWADYKSMVDVREHDRNRTKFNQMQDNLPYQISIITAIVVSFQQTTKQGLKAFSGLMSWKSPLRSLLFLWVVEYALYMGFLKILVPVVLAGLAFGMYRNVRKVQFTSLVIPEEKKQSVKEFFNTLKEIPAIMDEVQSTLQMINITLLKLRAVQTGCYVGDPGARLTLSYVVVAILLVVGFLLIWVPIYLIVMVVFAIMLRGYYADPTPIVTAAKSLYDSVPLADFKRVDE